MTTLFNAVQTPTAADCTLLRSTLQHSSAQMADLLYFQSSLDWRRIEMGCAACSLANWELLLLKTGLHPFQRLYATTVMFGKVEKH